MGRDSAVTWSRALAAQALADTIKAADDVGNRSVFARPPGSLNVPALVVSRPLEVRYGVASFGVDEAELPVVCLGPLDGDDLVDDLIGLVRSAVAGDPTLGGTVQQASATLERNWRAAKVGGADVLCADALVVITM